MISNIGHIAMVLDVDMSPPANIMTFGPGLTHLTFDLDHVTFDPDP